MGVPVLALFRENKIHESQYCCHLRNLNSSKFIPYTVVCVHCGPVVDFFITKQTSLHPFDFIRNLFHYLFVSFFMISKFISVLTKTLPFKCIGVALRLLNSQWKMHHCDVLCLVLSSLCSLQAYNYAEHLYFCALNSSPLTHFTRAPPSPAKNCYLNSRLMILHASELATELFDEVQYVDRDCKATSVVASRGWYYAIGNGV